MSDVLAAAKGGAEPAHFSRGRGAMDGVEGALLEERRASGGALLEERPVGERFVAAADEERPP
jgi:hypothetical protein